MQTDPASEKLSPSESGTYTPGYSGLKLLTILYGLGLFLAGTALIADPLRLVLTGVKTTGEATKVVVTKKGLADLTLQNEQQVETSLKPNDYSYTYWNDFEYQTEDGQRIEIRCPVGSRLQPLFPLVDADGLPTMCTVYYDRRHPDKVVFPLIVSTWFAPGALMIVGLLGAAIGSVLYYWARKPIKLPHLTSD